MIGGAAWIVKQIIVIDDSTFYRCVQFCAITPFNGTNIVI